MIESYVNHIMKITIQQIADLCNVSRGTVDRVLHNRPNVHPQIRQNILRMIERTGYRPPTTRHMPEQQYHIGMILPNFHDRYFLSHTKNGVKLAMDRIDSTRFHLSVDQLGGRSPEEYLIALERILQKNIDGLLVNAPRTPEITQMLCEISDRGIPIICYYDEQPDCPQSFFVGQDCLRSGQVAAGLISKYIAPNERVLAISGDPLFYSHERRVNGFAEYLCRQIGVPDCVDIFWCHEFYELTAQTVYTRLTEDERIRYIYMATQSDSGCIEGIRRAQLTESIMVICNDTTATARNLLKLGKVDFVIGQSVAKTIAQAIELMYQIVCAGVVPRVHKHYSDLTIFTRQMLQEKEMEL